MKKLIIAISLVISILTVASTPVGAANGEQISSFKSNITIDKSNTALINEIITYDFFTNYHHGIYRDIPIDYHDGKDTYYLDFKLIGVWDEQGNPIETNLTTENGNKRIRIGDPDITITGVHTYQIQYTLSPLVLKYNGKAFLNLDIVGEGWNVPIYNIEAKVSLKGDVPLTNVVWYGGVNTSTASNEALIYHIEPYHGVTINANLPDGYISNYLQPNKQRSEDITKAIWTLVITGLVISIGIAILTIFLVRKIRTKLRRKKQIVVAQYEPPKGLSPAHIGLLQDDVVEGREVTATIIDWAVHGYIKITLLPKKWIFGSKDYQINVIKPPNDLVSPEIGLFGAFFSGEKEIKLSKLNKVTVSSQIIQFKSKLKSQLTDKGYYDKNGNILMRGTLTEEGAKEWALVDGFKLYLSVVEKDRLDFSDAPEKTPERFNRLLPYAIALGVEKKWAKQFQNTDLSESTNWYSGNLAAFSAVSLASDLGNSFASTVSSNSSVSSSGGSSGGGFGGGGGGSW